ncbi:hypothetical protein M0813_21710 [Anaeramoeba flamelloides]|uniref:DDE-1 domain-containing protein n=1 Tax=Anaeramoeba flamelloides TaxID=1746091 RepID=A0ABQ8YH35_9EUKA|nr:hypothetical protein M0813_21710 [Anaeramoeba flamelloides]
MKNQKRKIILIHFKFHFKKQINESQQLRSSNESQQVRSSNESQQERSSNESQQLRSSNESQQVRSSNESQQLRSSKESQQERSSPRPKFSVEQMEDSQSNESQQERSSKESQQLRSSKERQQERSSNITEFSEEQMEDDWGNERHQERSNNERQQLRSSNESQQGRSSNIPEFSEEKIEELLEMRVFSYCRDRTFSERQIKDKNDLVKLFRQFPALMKINNPIEMLGSALCRKNTEGEKSIALGRVIGHTGRPYLLNTSEEEYVVQRLKILSLIGWAPTLDETIDIANEIIMSWFHIDPKMRRPLIVSKNWVRKFATRNKLKISKSTPIEYKRIMLSKSETYSVISPEIKKKSYRAKLPTKRHMSAICTISAWGELFKDSIFTPQNLLIRRANLAAIHLLQKHFVDCIVIPSHSSHLLQPLDVGIFKYFKAELRRQQRKKKKKKFFLLVDHCLNYATSTMPCVDAFEDAEFNFGEENSIIHITRSSSIEQFNKRMISDENNRKIEVEKRKNRSQNNTNESLLNQNQEILNVNSTEINSPRNKPVTLQPRMSVQGVNSNSQRHQLYGTESPIEPTIQTRTTNPREEELITPLSPGRTSITPSKNYIRSNPQNFFTPNRTQKHINRINEINRRISNGSKKSVQREKNRQLQTPNRNTDRSNRIENSQKRKNRPSELIDVEDSPTKISRNNSNSQFDHQKGRYSVTKNKLYHMNTITPTPVQRILYPSNRLSTHQKIIEHHQLTDLNQRNNIITDYFQPRNPDFNDLVLVQEQRFTKDTNKENCFFTERSKRSDRRGSLVGAGGAGRGRSYGRNREQGGGGDVIDRSYGTEKLIEKLWQREMP